LNSSAPTLKADLADIVAKTGGGVHASILLAESQAALELSAEITRKHGTVCLIAAVSLLAVLPRTTVVHYHDSFPKPPNEWKISPLYVIHKDLKFIGALLANPQACRDMIDLVEKHDIQVHTKVRSVIVLQSEHLRV
jgi:D-arabinose 1-dehydrogenase-like Zn-dependent alcohol dehydrogenase